MESVNRHGVGCAREHLRQHTQRLQKLRPAQQVHDKFEASRCPKLDAFRQALERAIETPIESGAQELSSFARSNDAQMADNLSKVPSPQPLRAPARGLPNGTTGNRSAPAACARGGRLLERCLPAADYRRPDSGPAAGLALAALAPGLNAIHTCSARGRSPSCSSPRPPLRLPQPVGVWSLLDRPFQRARIGCDPGRTGPPRHPDAARGARTEPRDVPGRVRGRVA